MAESDLKGLSDARRLIKQIMIESCAAYNELCGGKSEQTAYLVLDGQMRMASKLAQLEAAIKS